MSVACKFRPDALPSGVCHFPISLTRTLHIQPANFGGLSVVHRSLSKTCNCLTLTLHLSSPSFAKH